MTLRLLAPQVVPTGEVTRFDDLAPIRLDALPAPEDVDWVAAIGALIVLHVECQGYREAAFAERQFWYHLALALRHRPRRVETIALWLRVPPAAQRPEIIQIGAITVRVTPIILPRCSAQALLADPTTACFAAGADPGEWSVETPCERVGAALVATQASYYQRHMAVIAAATQGRYAAMVAAMEHAHLGPVIIEDLVHFGEDRGEARGLGPLMHQMERKLQRPLTEDERALLTTRLTTLGPARLGDVVMDLAGIELAAWMADPAAR